MRVNDDWSGRDERGCERGWTPCQFDSPLAYLHFRFPGANVGPLLADYVYDIWKYNYNSTHILPHIGVQGEVKSYFDSTVFFAIHYLTSPSLPFLLSSDDADHMLPAIFSNSQSANRQTDRRTTWLTKCNRLRCSITTDNKQSKHTCTAHL